MTTLFTTTLESAITGTNGFSSLVGSYPTLDTSAALKGAQSAYWPNVTSGYGRLTPGAAQSTVYVSFYLKLDSASAARFWRCEDSAGATAINLQLTTGGALRLRNGSTVIGTAATTIAVGTLYRIGVKVVASGTPGVSADGVAELYVATGDTAFGAAQVSSSAQVLNTVAKIDIGATNSTLFEARVDDIYWSDSAMPAASGSGTPPAAPSDLTATNGGATSINLAWTDNASDETAYTVERSTTGIGSWTVLSSTEPANATSYTATGLTTGTPYYFRVKATNANGASAYSAVASATPAAYSAWKWTELAWPTTERYRNITLAATGGVGYIAVTTGDPTDSSATWTCFSGPVVDDTLVLAASQSAAETSAAALPSDGRWVLPELTDARAVRLYHRATAGYTIREYYPRRAIEADDVTAEFIRGMRVEAGQLVVDQLSALSADLGTVTAGTFKTGESGARVVMTSATHGGLITYDTDDDYDPETGLGAYQVHISTEDGKLYFGEGYGSLGRLGMELEVAGALFSQIAFYDSGVNFAALTGSADGSTANISLSADHPTKSATISMLADAISLAGATTVYGTLATNGAIQPGGAAVSYTANRQTIANNAAVALGMSNFGFAFFAAGGAVALYAINGTSHTTTEIFDPSGVFSGASGTASSWNVYWSAANSRYELENKRGTTSNARIWLFDAA